MKTITGRRAWMHRKEGWAVTLAGLLALLLGAAAGGSAAGEELVTVDRFVPHVSTVPANAGQRVGLFLREKVAASTLARIEAGTRPTGRVVLFVHGGSVPSVPDYDLPYRDYSWMGALAAAGFDTFAMDHTGYGLSPRPGMDDPCNMEPDQQAVVTPVPLERPCAPRYAHQLTSNGSDWDEIASVVNYIRALRNVDRVSLIGWSGGGPRVGGYAARQPELVDKVVLFAPGYRSDTPSAPPAELPRPGVPMRLQTRTALMEDRWRSTVACENQIDPGIQAAIWQSIMAFDQLGAVWGSAEGVMRVRSSNPAWGWNREFAGRISVPTLVLVGEQDGLLPAAEALYGDPTTGGKVLVKMACATHFAVWEQTQYRFMHEASKQWLTNGTFRGRTTGIVSVAPDRGSASR